MESFGDNFGTQSWNLVTTPLAALSVSIQAALKTSSLSAWSWIFNSYCIGTSTLSSSSSKKEYLFNG